uniref:KCNMB2 ball/chain domain-containing protein n=1 Tax=Oryzias sinensis TaxID=183150 RepID=A0A8C7YC03_9TELE
MFLWVGTRVTEGSSDQRSIYQRIRDFEVLDRRKTVTALRAGEDRAILLGVSMILLSVMMYFVLGITVLRSYFDR